MIRYTYPLRIAVSRSRSFNDAARLFAFLNTLPHDVTAIVSGGAMCADSLAELWAVEHKVPMRIFEPEWSANPKGAGIERNEDIVRASEVLVAFWDGESRGTAFTIHFAEEAGKKVYVELF